MNSSRGIFEPQEGFAPVPPSKSPFSVADDGPASSPFAIVSEPESPFASMKDDHLPRPAMDPGRPAKLPERRPTAGEAVILDARSPFASEPMAQSPFDAPAASVSPFGATPPPVPSSAPASSPFAFAQEPAPAAAPAPVVAPVEVIVPAAPAPAAPAAAIHQAPAPVSVEADSYESDSSTIRQLALRAIFGVDRELGAEEMLQRARSLSGIRHVARIPAAEVATVDAFKRVIGSLGFAGGQVKLVAGTTPIEFIREGGVVLAVQNDGSFAPGVRETLMIVARELGTL
jgi:hypothetical protein